MDGLPKLPLIATICESCQKGRQTQTSFPKKSNSQAKQILKTIHSNLWGPINLILASKFRCFVTLTDDFSCKYCFSTSLSASQMPFARIQSYDGNINRTKVNAPRTNRSKEAITSRINLRSSTHYKVSHTNSRLHSFQNQTMSQNAIITWSWIEFKVCHNRLSCQQPSGWGSYTEPTS